MIREIQGGPGQPPVLLGEVVVSVSSGVSSRVRDLRCAGHGSSGGGGRDRGRALRQGPQHREASGGRRLERRVKLVSIPGGERPRRGGGCRSPAGTGLRSGSPAETLRISVNAGGRPACQRRATHRARTDSPEQPGSAGRGRLERPTPAELRRRARPGARTASSCGPRRLRRPEEVAALRAAAERAARPARWPRCQRGDEGYQHRRQPLRGGGPDHGAVRAPAGDPPRSGSWSPSTTWIPCFEALIDDPRLVELPCGSLVRSRAGGSVHRQAQPQAAAGGFALPLAPGLALLAARLRTTWTSSPT